MRKLSTLRLGALPPAIVLTLVLGACAAPDDDPAAITFGHVHGLGVNPADDRLYVATHDGLFVVDGSGPRRVSTDGDDLMGFAVVGPDRFLASGHPVDPDLPSPLGLARSTDNATTWESISLGGRADLHAIESSGPRVVAYDSTSETIVASDDAGLTFTTRAELPSIDIAVDDEQNVLATGLDGAVWRVGRSGAPEQVTTAPRLTYMDSAEETVGLGPDGRVWVSGDGRDWERRGDLPGQPQAITIEDSGWFAATTTGLFRSADAGVTWESVL